MHSMCGPWLCYPTWPSFGGVCWENCELAYAVFVNLSHRSSKLKDKKYMATSCLFVILVDSKTYLMYNSDVGMNFAIRQAYTLNSHGKLTDLVTHLHREMNRAWNLHQSILLKILTILTSSGPTCSNRMQSLVHSFDQDISCALTSGAWKQPKHMLLFITLHHIFKSEKRIEILNRFGHCENCSFSLKLETAIVQPVCVMSLVLSTQIILIPDISAVFRSEFDDFDQLNFGGNGFCSYKPWNNSTWN